MILVAGATGTLGRRIVDTLARRGEAVRALVRPGRAAAPFAGAPVEVVEGDLRDPASLRSACTGARGVITTASVSKTGSDSIDKVDGEGNQNLIAAAEEAGVEHFVFVSTLSAAEDSPVPLFRLKYAAERRLRDARMIHTILRPNAFMDVWFGMLVEAAAFSDQPVTLVGESRRRHAFVAEQDVAAFAVGALSAAAGRNATVAIGGPEALSLRDVVRAYEQAAARPISVRTVAPGEPIPGLPEQVWGLAAALETFDSPVPMEETSRAFNVTLTSVAEFARTRVAQNLAPGT